MDRRSRSRFLVVWLVLIIYQTTWQRLNCFTATTARSVEEMPPAPSSMATASFSHVHIYCDSLKELSEYKKLEDKLNAFADAAGDALKPTASRVGADVAAGRAAWLKISESHGDPCTGKADPAKYVSSKQDVVEQMLVGLGWRITGHCQTDSTRSLVLTSKDGDGVKFVITADNKCAIADFFSKDSDPAAKRAKVEGETFDHFSATHLARFSQNKAGRAGVAILGFKVKAGGLDLLIKNYKEMHPKLVLEGTPKEYPGAKILEVFAYYKGEKCVSDADRGTVLRFVEYTDASPDFWVLPGVKKQEAKYDPISYPAYCDHWVSNVVSRTGFLETLNDVLGFTPKVDFNAGVVAAGEAQIESTVTGNDPSIFIPDPEVALTDQSQIYLPTNNALSEVGHVHLYIKEIGQGIQHIASRVKDLPSLVQNANDFREMTGAGFTFLNIPRSYYGCTTARYLSKEGGVELSVAESAIEALQKAEIVDSAFIMDLKVSRDQVKAALPSNLQTNEGLLNIIMQSRYGNLYALLRDHIGEAAYLKIVRNKVLVDVQGDDLLLQIFTSKILEREAGQEAPFLEFIQRICSEKKDPKTGKPKPMKPGCGGFGIRNFLTLFLSIEVSKASSNRADALKAGKTEHAEYYSKMVDAFTNQLQESNPVLTAISDAMTAEGEALESGDAAGAKKWLAEKESGSKKLQEISTKYKNHMKSLRENAPAGA